ncbi:MAG: hypothetical protein ISS70_10190 [Phycisphaerae bacterium]|nr:hypothetical protein [Phycisphaerae bacterium]
MNNEEQKGLQKVEFYPNLPAGFDELSDHEKLEIVKRIQEQDLEVRKEVMKKIGKSKVAENDLYTAIGVIQQLDQEKKIYSQHHKGETGSGTYDLTVRGGDTKFIVPILVVIGVIILAVILLIALLKAN